MPEDVMRLTQELVSEADRVTATFVSLHRVHATDVLALTQVVVAEDAGSPVTAGSLGQTLGLTSGAVTALVDRLERAGTLRRRRDDRDRRRVLVEVTDEGRALSEEYLGPVRRRTEEVLGQFTAAELAVVGRYLRSTIGAMAAHREQLAGQSAPVPR